MLTYGISRITLIIPPSVFLLDERVFMMLGILRIAAVLRMEDYVVEVLDLSGIRNFTDAVRDHVSQSQSTVFGLTATTPQMPAATEVLRVIREVRPDARVILGGPHVTLVNAARKSEIKRGITGRAHDAFNRLQQSYDVLVAGDGEIAIHAACKPYPGKLIDADDPKSLFWLTNQKLEDLPFPARDLVDWKSYRYTIDGVEANSLIAQLGCPFQCGFCGGRESAMLRRIRTRTSESIVAEMTELYRMTDRPGFMFYDDELNVNRGMVDLMKLIALRQRELGVEWRLRGFIKAELFTEEQAAAMYAAGFRWILTGFESGSPRILENINKKSTRDENSRCVAIARKYGLKVKALMSIGHPGESKDTVLDTLTWLLEAKPDDFDVTIITTYPGTPYYDEAVPLGGEVWKYTYAKTGDRLYQRAVDFTVDAEYYKGAPDGGYKAFVWTDHLSSEDLVSLRDHVEHSVRTELGISYPHYAPTQLYEHSMGQLPPNILRSSDNSSKTVPSHREPVNEKPIFNILRST